MFLYLLVFVLGELYGKIIYIKNGIFVGLYVIKVYQLNELDFFLDIVVCVIEFYEDYFGVCYFIFQLFYVVLFDFFVGVMENWGLVIYCEVYFLVDENFSVFSCQ